MTDHDPVIRAHYAKLALKRLRAYPEGRGAEIRERVAATTLTTLREVASPDWVPVGDFITICEAILAVLGEPAAREFWTELMRDSYDHGLLKPLTMLAQYTLGQSGAAKLMRTAPQAWVLSTRNCGDIEFAEQGAAADSAAGMRLQGVDLIPEILHSKGFACVFYGACRAMLELFKARGEVLVREHVPPGAERPQLAFEIRFERGPSA